MTEISVHFKVADKQRLRITSIKAKVCIQQSNGRKRNKHAIRKEECALKEGKHEKT